MHNAFLVSVLNKSNAQLSTVKDDLRFLKIIYVFKRFQFVNPYRLNINWQNDTLFIQKPLFSKQCGIILK